VDNQFVEYDGVTYQATSGIATGLSSGVIAANAYLDSLDHHIVAGFPQGGCLYYRRFVDDGGFILRADLAHRLPEHLNSWHSNIRFDITAQGDAAPYLDLSLYLEYDPVTNTKQLRFSTYRKPMNKYCYLPRSSCVPPHIFDGIVATETMRMLKTNDNPLDFLRNLNFFFDRLVDRGYDRQEVTSAALRQLRKPQIRTKEEQPLRRFMVTTYGSTTDASFLRRCLRRYAYLLYNIGLDAGLAFSSQKSLFRLLYRRNWPV